MNSDWVGTEIANAREREAREGKQMLFPVTIVPFEMVRSWKLSMPTGARIRRARYASSSSPTSATGRTTTRFRKAFDRLLKDLKSPDAGAKSAATAKD
jgi:hypothetical protein